VGATSFVRRLGRHRLASALVLAAVAVIVLTGYALRHAYSGDASIYLSYARNAAAGDLFQFNVGQFSSGSTSPLWSLLLGTPFLFGLGLMGAKAFAVIFTVIAFLTTLAAAQRVSGSWTAAAAASLFFLGPATYFAVSLYESGLVLALSALALIAGQRAHRHWHDEGRLTPRAAAPLVATWAALPLARPDAVIIVAAQAVALFAFAPGARRRAASALLAALAVAAIPAAAYFGYSLAELGTFSTSSQERTYALHEVSRHLVGPLYRSAEALREQFRSPWVFGLVPALLGLALLARRRPTRWLGSYGLAVLGGYLLLLTFVAPALYDTYRYLLPTVPIVAAGVAYLLAQARGSGLWWLAVGAAIVAIGGSAGLWLRDSVNVLESFVLTNHEVFERDVTARINRLARPGDAVLSYEVQVRYYLRRDLAVLSQDGITDGKVRPYQDRHDMTGFLLRYRPRWWIADQNVKFRRYLHGSVLERALDEFIRNPRPSSRTLDGIRFRLMATRNRPIARGFGGWQMLFQLGYPSGSRASAGSARRYAPLRRTHARRRGAPAIRRRA
jgi:hypothetical protein